MSLDYFFADSEPHAGSGIFLLRVQALEDHKNSLMKVGRNADAVITYEDSADVVAHQAADFNAWFWALILPQTIQNKILEETSHLARINVKSRQVGTDDVGLFLLDDGLEIFEGVPYHLVEVCRDKL